MLSSKLIISDIKQVPSSWVFERYLNLPEKLTGQSLKIKSIFNLNDTDPSFCLFVGNSNEYMFKDFSADISGDKVDLVSHMFKINRGLAIYKILNDFLESGSEPITVSKTRSVKWIVGDYNIRPFKKRDAEYWTSYGINRRLLIEYNIKPLSYIKMEKLGSDYRSFFIEDDLMYGYFNNDDNLCKVYTPFAENKKRKFVTVDPSYIHGFEQLKYDKPYLIIGSSMKDILSMKQFNYNIEYIASQSEGIMLNAIYMNNFIQKYKQVIPLFDNDEAGRKYLKAYEDVYGVKGFTLKMKKDVALSVKDCDLKEVNANLIRELKKVING